MASESAKADFGSKMAFIVGHTGETGKVLVQELLKRKVFKKLILIGRREVKLEGDLYKDAVSRPPCATSMRSCQQYGLLDCRSKE